MLLWCSWASRPCEKVLGAGCAAVLCLSRGGCAGGVRGGGRGRRSGLANSLAFWLFSFFGLGRENDREEWFGGGGGGGGSPDLQISEENRYHVIFIQATLWYYYYYVCLGLSVFFYEGIQRKQGID